MRFVLRACVPACAFGVMLAAAAPIISAQTPQKRFLTAPLVIEDQGSFFIGGVPKVTEHATVPPAPGAPPTAAAAVGLHQITIGQMYVQFQIPAKKYGAGWPVIMVHGSSHTAACLEATPDGREGWYRISCARACPATSSIRRDAGDRGSTRRSFTRVKPGSAPATSTAART